MAALRSLAPESPQEIAVWRREFNRRLRDSNVCVICGCGREWCVCEDWRANYSSDDAGVEVGVE